MRDDPDNESVGRFAYEGLDRALHEKARLGILVSLATRSGGLLFGELKQLCSLTDGNLNRHLDVLAKAHLIDVRKDREGRRPQTIITLTDDGRQRFLQYLGELERVLEDARKQTAEEPEASPKLANG
jgi:DNA-binding transcriptional ArsR family regulator